MHPHEKQITLVGQANYHDLKPNGLVSLYSLCHGSGFEALNTFTGAAPLGP